MLILSRFCPIISEISNFLYLFNAPSSASFSTKFFITDNNSDLPLPLLPTIAFNPGEK